MDKKEEMLREAVHNHYQCNGKHACEERAYCRFCEGENIAHDCDEDCFADEFSEGFLYGWDACLKHLGEIPWNEAMDEITNHITDNRSENPNSSKKKEDNEKKMVQPKGEGEIIELDTILEYRNGQVYIKKMNTNEMPVTLTFNLIEALNKTIVEYYKKEV